MKLKKEKLRIRNYKKGDYWFCYYLLKRNMFDHIEKYQGGWDSKRHRKHFIEKNIRVVGYSNRRIAFYNIEKRKNELILIDMQVTSKYQGRGLGTYLLETLERRAKKSGFGKVILGVYWDNPSINLYKRLGYKIEKRRKTHAVMSKKV